MLQLRIYGLSESLTDVGQGLERDGAARNVALVPGVRAGHVLLTAEVAPDATDDVLEALMRGGIARQDIALARLDELTPMARGHSSRSLIWADVLGQASANARPVARFLVFMVAAGLIAAYGVIEPNTILIVGAMAVSPDLLPITAACVGLAGLRAHLVTHALVTLLLGLGATGAAAAMLTVVLELLDLLPAGFHVGESGLSGLTTVNDATIVVAFAAGVAGMLALETRASSAVGVGISITTIPAAAYFGVAVADGEVTKATGALAVLGVNVAMLLVAGTLTLIVQRRLGARAARA
jgi:uncharacterized hydrophobic protein (TIGR00271 family)